MFIVADCGSTKIHWCAIEGARTVNEQFTTGMNAIMMTREEMSAQLGRELTEMPRRVDAVYFYGAGCISEDVCKNVADAIADHISSPIIEVHTDLLAAARALCGRDPGIACIMGTGSNSCYYDGNEIVDNVSPLGYILGDEGSGAVLGKILVGDVLKHQLPDDLCRAFHDETGLDRLEIIKRVYREPAANRFLASLTPFLSRHIDRPEIQALVVNAFSAFFRRNVLQYAYAHSLPVNFVGSIAFYFKDQLVAAAEKAGCTIGMVLKEPMVGLIVYHNNLCL